MQKIIYTLFILGFWGCTTLKPDSSQVSRYDINKRVEIENPRYYNQLNIVGYGSIVATTAAGAYAGYQTKAIRYNSGTEQKTLDVGNALIGAAVGFTVSYYANRLLGWGATPKATNAEDWLKKANNNYALLNRGQGNSIRAIHKSIETSFTLENLHDAQDFARAFPNSPHTDRIIDQALSSDKLPRSDYSNMAQIFAKNANATKLKKEYISRSTTVTEIFEGVAKYPNTGLPVEQMATDLVVNYRDVELFFSKFPNSKYGKQALMNGLQGCTENEVLTLYKKMRQYFQISPNEFNQLKLTSEAKAGYFNAQFVIYPPKNVTEVHNKVREYGWIDYPQRPMNILSQVWKVGYTTISNGDDLVASIWNLSKNSNYKYYKLTPQITSQFIVHKLEEEIQKNVSIVSTKALEPQNPEWENWKASTYTAGVVTTKGVGKYLIYGEIQNKSRFSLPIKIATTATLLSIAEVDMGVIGTIADVLEKGLDFFRQSAGPRPPTKSVRSVGNAEDFYIVPDFKPSEKAIYVTMLDFGTGVTNTGIDASSIIGGVKGKTELKLANVNQNIGFISQPMSSSQLLKQKQAQEFVKNGLPQATVHDFIRNGKEVKEAEWHAEWLEIQRRREIYERERQARLSSACVYKEEDKPYESTVCGGDKVIIRKITCYEETHRLFMASEAKDRYNCLIFGKEGTGWFEREIGVFGDTKYLNEYTGKLIIEDISLGSFEKAVRIACGCQKAED
jgi:hypothetical protein